MNYPIQVGRVYLMLSLQLRFRDPGEDGIDRSEENHVTETPENFFRGELI
jgi:hypothetical protein